MLLAIKPRFADLIISGQKVVEVRRGGTSIKVGDVLVLYKSGPNSGVCGTCSVVSVNTTSTGAAEATVNRASGLSEDELREYLRGANKVTLIGLGSVARLRSPIPLATLRRVLTGVVIPQSYRFLKSYEINTLMALAGREMRTDSAAILR